MSDGRILIVDDEEHVRRLAISILSEHGYDTVAAEGAAAAIDCVGLEDFDLLLIDVAMPGMDGFALLEQVRLIRKDIPVVFVTGYGTIDNALRALQAGASGFIVKPFTIQELLEGVAEALGRHRRIREAVRLRLLTPLVELEKSLSTEVERHGVLETATKVGVAETQSDAGLIFVLREGQEGPQAVTVVGPDTRLARQVASGLPGLVGWSELRVIDGRFATEAIRQAMHRCGFSALINSPVTVDGEKSGWLLFCRRQGRPPYSRSDVELAELLGRQASGSVRAIKLVAELAAGRSRLEEFCFSLVQAITVRFEPGLPVSLDPSQGLLRYASALADRLGLAAEDRTWLGFATALRDIGKLLLDRDILNKADRLTPEEFQLVRSYPAKSAEILREIEFLAPVLPIIYHHQEWFDGKGYPAGLVGEQIPISSRILAVLDAFEAMTAERPYRKGLDSAEAINELRRRSGIQFDPRVVEQFVDLVSNPA